MPRAIVTRIHRAVLRRSPCSSARSATISVNDDETSTRVAAVARRMSSSTPSAGHTSVVDRNRKYAAKNGENNMMSEARNRIMPSSAVVR